MAGEGIFSSGLPCEVVMETLWWRLWVTSTCLPNPAPGGLAAGDAAGVVLASDHSRNCSPEHGECAEAHTGIKTWDSPALAGTLFHLLLAFLV